MQITLRQSGQDSGTVIKDVLYFEPFFIGQDSYVQFTAKHRVGVQVISYDPDSDSFVFDGAKYAFCSVNNSESSNLSLEEAIVKLEDTFDWYFTRVGREEPPCEFLVQDKYWREPDVKDLGTLSEAMIILIASKL